jgi:hypothetical protein
MPQFILNAGFLAKALLVLLRKNHFAREFPSISVKIDRLIIIVLILLVLSLLPFLDCTGKLCFRNSIHPCILY